MILKLKDKNLLEDNDLYDYIILILMFLQLTILEFFGLGRILNKLLLLVVLLKTILIDKKIDKKYLYIFIIIGGLFILSVLFSNPISFSIAKSNFLMYLYPMAYAFYIRNVCVNKPHIITNCFKKGFYIFNAVILINFIVLYIQIIFPYSINAVRTITEVTYYKDLISGLFEYCSVHLLNLFFIFIILYNYEYSKRISDIKQKKVIFGYILFLLINEMIISNLNDNKMFFPVFLVVIFVKIVYELNNANKLSMKKILSIIGIIALVLLVAYIIISPVRNYVDETIIGLFERVLTQRENTNGSAERVAIFFYALIQGSTWLYGKGLGTAKLYTSGYCGFAHFGQSDLGSALMLGGMAFTIAMITYYCFIICDITSTRKKDYPNIISFILLILCFMLFIQCISRTNLMMVILMILMTFQFMRRKENEDENRNSYIYQWEQLWTKITKLRNARSL